MVEESVISELEISEGEESSTGISRNSPVSAAPIQYAAAPAPVAAAAPAAPARRNGSLACGSSWSPVLSQWLVLSTALQWYQTFGKVGQSCNCWRNSMYR